MNNTLETCERFQFLMNWIGNKMYIIQGKVIRAYETVITYSYKFKVIIYIWQTKVTFSEYLGFSKIQFLIRNVVLVVALKTY